MNNEPSGRIKSGILFPRMESAAGIPRNGIFGRSAAIFDNDAAPLPNMQIRCHGEIYAARFRRSATLRNVL